jgi:predicted transcriptional regulator
MNDVVTLYKNSESSAMGYPVVDAMGAIQGFLTAEEINTFIQTGVDGSKLVRDILAPSYSITYADEPLRVAADRMAQSNTRSLPVADPSDAQKAVGIVTREDLFAARVHWFGEEKIREKALTIPTFSMRKVIQDGRGRFRKWRNSSRDS